MRIPRLLLCVLCVSLIPFAGCGADKTAEGPEVGAVQRYLDENPEAAARIDDDEDVEPDGDG